MGVHRQLKVLRHLRRPSDLFLALHIFLFAVGLPILLRLKLPRLATWLAPKNAPATPEPARIQKIVRYVDVVLQGGRPLVRPGCLTRALTLYYFLSRTGLDVELCFGMGNIGGTLVGHCWVVKNGEPFLEARDPRPLFTAIYCLPGERRSRGSGI